MNFQYSRYGLTGGEKRLQRFLEALPGACSWAILIGMLGLSFWKPVWAAVVVIAFHLYWLLRLLFMTLFLVLSYIRLSIERETDWMGLIRALEAPESEIPSDPNGGRGQTFKRRIARALHQQELRRARRLTGPLPRLGEIIHLVIFPVAREREEIYAQGVESLLEQGIPLRQILVVLAVEERSSAEVQAGAARLARRYRDRFLSFEVVVHPDGLPGEARVKGANATTAARWAADHLRDRGIPFEKVILSCLDADTVLSPQYMACLTYQFMICPDRTRASFQPIPVYHNNIWEVPGFARVLDVGSSFFQLVEATNPEKLVTFSSHSMSFKALTEVGFWPVDMISDDSAIFWKSFIFYEGEYRVVAMYVTVSMDVAASRSWRGTAVNVYRQKRRWAWGVENLPVVMRAFLKKSRIPLCAKIRHGAKLWEGHLAWATWPFLVAIIGWLPAFFVGREFSNSVLSYSAPRVTWTIFHLASMSLAITICLSVALLPRAAVKRPLLKKAWHLLEWLLVPVISILFSAIPALDAQTRLALGRRMEFWVTEKRRIL